MNVFSCLHNLSCLSLSCYSQTNGIDICLGYSNLRGILDGKWTAHYKSISDILISSFSGVIETFIIDFGLS